MNINLRNEKFSTTVQSVGKPNDSTKKVQDALICRYYLYPGDDTGLYDQKTVSAVSRYQLDRSKGNFWALNMPLAVDGKVGPHTMGRLYPPTVRLGSKGDYVLLAQLILIQFGYEPGYPDGDFGPITESAVKEFQKANSDCDDTPLDPDGVIGRLTWGSLWS